MFHRLVKLEAAEATRVEASRVALQRAEDERPLADQTGTPQTSIPSTGVVGTMAWEDLGRYHHDTIQPLSTALKEAHAEILFLKDVTANMQGWEAELDPLAARCLKNEDGLEEVRQTTTTLAVQVKEILGQSQGRRAVPVSQNGEDRTERFSIHHQT